MATKKKNDISVNPIIDAEERKKALKTSLSQIEKKYGTGAVMRLGDNAHMEVQAVSTGSIALDIALGIGGVPRGRIVEIYGPESSGKTTVALHIIAEVQKAGGEAAFIDAEHALDPGKRRNGRITIPARNIRFCALATISRLVTISKKRISARNICFRIAIP